MFGAFLRLASQNRAHRTSLYGSHHFVRVSRTASKHAAFAASVSVLFVFVLWPFTGYASHAININTADSATLDTLPGIGPAIAQKIIDGRPYASTSEISKVQGIGEPGSKTYDDLIGHITVSGGTSTVVPSDEENATQEEGNTGTSVSKKEPAIPVGSLVITVPKIAHVNQSIEFDAKPREGTNERLVRYHWNFGDASTADTKSPTHAYAYPGTYVVTLESYYTKQSLQARTEIIILAPNLSLARDGRGNIQIRNDAKEEIDIGNFIVRGDSDFLVPKGTIILPNETLTISRGTVEQGMVATVYLYDSSGVLIASSMPYVPQANAEKQAIRTSAVSSLGSVSSTQVSTSTVADSEEQPVFRSDTAQNVAAASDGSVPRTPFAAFTYLGFAGVLLLGTIGVFMRKKV